jgi:hypothetical protein
LVAPQWSSGRLTQRYSIPFWLKRNNSIGSRYQIVKELLLSVGLPRGVCPTDVCDSTYIALGVKGGRGFFWKKPPPTRSRTSLAQILRLGSAFPRPGDNPKQSRPDIGRTAATRLASITRPQSAKIGPICQQGSVAPRTASLTPISISHCRTTTCNAITPRGLCEANSPNGGK